MVRVAVNASDAGKYSLATIVDDGSSNAIELFLPVAVVLRLAKPRTACTSKMPLMLQYEKASRFQRLLRPLVNNLPSMAIPLDPLALLLHRGPLATCYLDSSIKTPE